MIRSTRRRASVAYGVKSASANALDVSKVALSLYPYDHLPLEKPRSAGPLALDQVLPIARQIVDALTADSVDVDLDGAAIAEVTRKYFLADG